MKLNFMERLMTNSPVRGVVQSVIEGPTLRTFAARASYPLCLELGAGVGRGAEIILKLFGALKVVATDIDPAQVEKAKKRIKGKRLEGKVVLKVENAMSIAERDNSFDAVFAFGVIHHTEDWRMAIREIQRVLKPGGEYFFDELLKGFVGSAPVRIMTSHPEGGMFTSEEFMGYMKEIGLEPLGHRRFDGMWLMGSARKRA
jgi:ubiquinone/menaquinone biosynthesis C-methylase UbiE